MTVDSEALRRAMRLWATGVTIVAAEHASIRHGMTVTSFTSISLDPPLLLVSIEQTTRTHDLVRDSGYFGVTILGSHQSDISDRFAGRLTEDTDRFAGLEVYTLETGSPFLKDALACFDCRVESDFSMGNHTIFIGEVVALCVPKLEAGPLIYFDQGYRELISRSKQDY